MLRYRKCYLKPVWTHGDGIVLSENYSAACILGYMEATAHTNAQR